MRHHRQGRSSRISRPVTLAVLSSALLASAYLLTPNLPASPLWNAELRILPAGLLLLACRPAAPPSGWWWRSGLLGLLNFGGFFALQAQSLHRLPAGTTAVIISMQAVLVPIGANLMLHERLGRRKLAVAVVGVVGIGLLVLNDPRHLDVTGLAAAGLTMVCMCAGILLVGRWNLPAPVHHTTATAWQMLAGAAILLPAAALSGPIPAMTPTQWAYTGWIAVAATAGAFTALFGSVHHGLTPATASRLLLLVPLLTTAGAWLLQRQTLTPIQLIGGALALASVACAFTTTTDATRTNTVSEIRIPTRAQSPSRQGGNRHG